MTDSNDDFSQGSWLGLALVERVPLEAKLACLGRWSSPGEVLRQSARALAGCHPEAAPIAAGVDPGRVGLVLDWASASGGGLLFLGDEGYPEQVAARLHDPPLALFVRGSLIPLGRPVAALAGSPRPSEAGAARARTLALELAQEGITVAAGVSQGIAQAALRGALATPAPSVGVIGDARAWEGVRIAEEIAASGLLISEIAPQEGSRRQGYARRYRLLAALASLLVLVEAPRGCDTLELAAVAGDLGCEVAAYPCSPERNEGRGGNLLLRDGAALVEGTADVLRLLQHPS